MSLVLTEQEESHPVLRSGSECRAWYVLYIQCMMAFSFSFCGLQFSHLKIRFMVIPTRPAT